MIKRRAHIGIIIFAIGVLTVLCRPYFVYVIASGHLAKANPVKTWRLLQRLVKKKDDHHDYVAEPAVITNQLRATVLPVVKLSRVLRYTGNNSKLVATNQTSLHKTLIPIQRHRYLLMSCFLI